MFLELLSFPYTQSYSQFGHFASQVYDQWGDVICHGDASIIREGHKSFPSGHTSCKRQILQYLLIILL